MSAYEGSKQQEEDEKRLKFTEGQAINLAVSAVKSMGIPDLHKKEIEQAYQDGYNQALQDVNDGISKLKK